MNATGTALVASTYVCGSGTDWVNDLDVDAAGNVYLVLQTTSADLPRLGARQTELRGPNDTWVAKLNSNLSSLLLSTFVGGTESDIGTSIAVGADGSVFVGGKTNSRDFPTLYGVQMAYAGSPNVCFDGTCGDGFLAKLRPDFGLASATYLGGSNDDDVASIALSAAGVVAVGTTVSTSFPLVSPLQSTFRGKRDAFVATLGLDLRTLTFSTFLGGAEWDIGLAADVDAEGAIYVTGYTGSNDFPVSNAWQAAEAGNFDAFVVKLGGPAPPVRHRRAVRH